MIVSGHSIFDRTYWSLRLHFWLWRENRALARFQSRTAVLIADRRRSQPSAPNGLFLGDTKFVTEVAKQLQLQPLIFGDGQSFIKSISGELLPDEQCYGCEAPKTTLAEQEANLIAEYDAHFLASTRIKSPVQPSTC